MHSNNRTPKNDRWVDLVLTLNGLACFTCLLMASGNDKFPAIPAFLNLGVMGLIIRFAHIHFKDDSKERNDYGR
jgi:hypothetical protein